MIYAFIPVSPNVPIGGIRSLLEYLVCLETISAGDKCAVLTDSPYFKDWVPSSLTKIKVYRSNHPVTEHDSIIVPEICPNIVKNYANAKMKYLSVLNWYYYDLLIKKKTPIELGYDHILTNSLFSLKYLKKKNIGLPITVISPIIDSSIYSIKKAFEDRPYNSILILNRKNNHHIQPILNYLKDSTHQVTIINNINPELISDIYNSNQIFINLGYPEGFCLPAAEALACGCIVVGFTGGGAREFLLDKINSFTSPDKEENKLIKNLDYVLNKISLKNRKRMSIISSQAILKRYSKENAISQTYEAFKTDLIHGNIVKSKLAKIKRNKAKIKLFTRKLSKRGLLLNQLIKENSYLKYTLKTSRDLFSNSKIYKIWRKYREIIELRFLQGKIKLHS
jgi:glycosyltransferase involved in cell wall biosynthesis